MGEGMCRGPLVPMARTLGWVLQWLGHPSLTLPLPPQPGQHRVLPHRASLRKYGCIQPDEVDCICLWLSLYLELWL